MAKLWINAVFPVPIDTQIDILIFPSLRIYHTLSIFLFRFNWWQWHLRLFFFFRCTSPQSRRGTWFIYLAINHLFTFRWVRRRVQSKDRRRDLHLSLGSNREAYRLQRWPLEPVCLGLCYTAHPLLHCGLNNIIKNGHQRTHCKQIILLGAWRTN